MKNLKFFSEFTMESIKSKKYENSLNEIVQWLVDNTSEGKTYIKSTKKMSIVLDMIIMLVMNSIFVQTVTQETPFMNDASFEYMLSIIEKGMSLFLDMSLKNTVESLGLTSVDLRNAKRL